MTRKRKANRPRGCVRCHEVKLPERYPMGRGGVRRSAVCWACTEDEAWTHYRERVITRQTWIDPATGERVRRCKACGEVKPLEGEFYVRDKVGKLDLRGHRVLTARYNRLCRRCHNRDTNAREMSRDNEARRKRRIEQRRAASRRYRERHPDRARASVKRWKTKVMRDPKRHTQYLEDVRINYRLRQARKGKPVGNGQPARRQRRRAKRLPAAPLAALLMAEVEARLVVEPFNKRGPIEDVCAKAGITARTLYRWRSEPNATAKIGVAEKVLLVLHREWHEVYPDHADDFLVNA